MKRMFYYARLNNDNVCIGFASYPKRYEDMEGMVLLPEYNESYLFRKWENNQWSSETFEPSVPVDLQERLDYLEGVVETQEQTNSQMINTMQLLEGTIAELMTVLGGMQ